MSIIILYDEAYNKSKLKSYGLNKFGEEVVKTCEENKVLIDVSHIGEKSFWDLASISSKPFIASHSSVYKLCPHFRNLKDDQIKEIKKKKGLIGLNPYPFFGRDFFISFLILLVLIFLLFLYSF